MPRSPPGPLKGKSIICCRCQELAEKGIVRPLAADGADRAVTRIDDRAVVQNKERGADRFHQVRKGASGKVGSADAVLEEYVSNDGKNIAQKRDMPGRMAGRVDYGEGLRTDS